MSVVNAASAGIAGMTVTMARRDLRVRQVAARVPRDRRAHPERQDPDQLDRQVLPEDLPDRQARWAAPVQQERPARRARQERPAPTASQDQLDLDPQDQRDRSDLQVPLAQRA